MRQLTSLAFFVVFLCANSDLRAADKWAILIGINHYKDFHNIPDLRFCESDAQEMKRVLTQDCGYDAEHVLLMHSGLDWRRTDSRTRLPDTFNLRTMIPKWLKNAKADDTVLFYFSGHGFLDEGRGFLTTMDCDFSRLAETGISTNELRDWLQGCEAKRKVLILDSCHSGAANAKGEKTVGNVLGAELGRKAKRLSPGFKLALKNSEGLVILTSCDKGEESYEWPEEDEQGMGLFTHYLTRGLQGKADDDKNGIVTHHELYSFVHQKVSLQAQQWNLTQTPMLYTTPETKGIFELSRIALEIVPTESEKASIPPPPDVQATRNYELLTSGQGTYRERNDAATALVESIEQLRRALPTRLPQRRCDPFMVPYFNEERKTTAKRWLAAVRDELIKQEKEAPQSLILSEALLEPKLLNSIAGTEFPFDAPYCQEYQAFCLHRYARNEQDPSKSIDAYGRCLKFLHEFEILRAKPLNTAVIRHELLDPALKLAEDLVAKPKTRHTSRLVANIYGHAAQLIENRNEFEDFDEATEYFEKSLEIDPDNPENRNGLSSILLQARADRRNFQRVQQLTLPVRKNVTTSVGVRATSFRLAGDAIMRESRLVKDNRIDYVKEAMQEYDTAIALFERLPEREMTARLKSHFGDSFAGRCAALLDIANLQEHIGDVQRKANLSEILTDAERAKSLNPTSGYNAFLAIGNACEDLVWLRCINGLEGDSEYWSRSAEAFEAAIQINFNEAYPYVCLGRMQYKREVDGNQPGYLEDARKNLEQSLEIAETAEACYWLARMYRDDAAFEESEAYFEKAIDLYTQKGRKSPPADVARTYMDWIRLAFDRSDDAVRREDLSASFEFLSNVEHLAARLAEWSNDETLVDRYRTRAKYFAATLEVQQPEQAPTDGKGALSHTYAAIRDIKRLTRMGIAEEDKVLWLVRHSELIRRLALVVPDGWETFGQDAISSAEAAVRKVERLRGRDSEVLKSLANGELGLIRVKQYVKALRNRQEHSELGKAARLSLRTGIELGGDAHPLLQAKWIWAKALGKLYESVQDYESAEKFYKFAHQHSASPQGEKAELSSKIQSLRLLVSP